MMLRTVGPRMQCPGVARTDLRISRNALMLCTAGSDGGCPRRYVARPRMGRPAWSLAVACGSGMAEAIGWGGGRFLVGAGKPWGVLGPLSESIFV